MSTLPIAMALSGGGVRAIAFHLGVLRYMAANHMLERVTQVSSVSGGSLAIGLVMHAAGMQWPSSVAFLGQAYPDVRKQLCTSSLQNAALRQLLNPANLRFCLSRTNLLAFALRDEWGIRSRLADLPETPEWSINATTAETGKRFRFKSRDFGDYTLGYASSLNFPLAHALAVSAALPGGLGPLTFDTRKYAWRKREWDAPVGSDSAVSAGFDRLHLYDGGVYDNLGLEPFFDAGRGQIKQPGHYIVASDAGKPLPVGFDMRSLNPFRFKRVADIMSDQSRALRVRTFHSYIQGGPDRGAFLYIGTPTSTEQPCTAAQFAVAFPTTLRRLSSEEFDRLADHGYAVAEGWENVHGFNGRG